MARGAPVSSRGGRVEVTSRGRLVLDLEKVARAIGPAIVGHVLERVAAGLDIHDRPFAPYTPEYAEWLRQGGEGTDVDLRVTGGLLGSVAVRSIHVEGDKATIVVGPGTGTSEERRASGTGLTAFETLRGAAPAKPSKGKKRLQKTGRRGPPHNLVGAYLSRKRPWLGVSPKGMRELQRLIETTPAFRGGA